MSLQRIMPIADILIVTMSTYLYVTYRNVGIQFPFVFYSHIIKTIGIFEVYVSVNIIKFNDKLMINTQHETH